MTAFMQPPGVGSFGFNANSGGSGDDPEENRRFCLKRGHDEDNSDSDPYDDDDDDDDDDDEADGQSSLLPYMRNLCANCMQPSHTHDGWHGCTRPCGFCNNVHPSVNGMRMPCRVAEQNLSPGIYRTLFRISAVRKPKRKRGRRDTTRTSATMKSMPMFRPPQNQVHAQHPSVTAALQPLLQRSLPIRSAAMAESPPMQEPMQLHRPTAQPTASPAQIAVPSAPALNDGAPSSHESSIPQQSVSTFPRGRRTILGGLYRRVGPGRQLEVEVYRAREADGVNGFEAEFASGMNMSLNFGPPQPQLEADLDAGEDRRYSALFATFGENEVEPE